MMTPKRIAVLGSADPARVEELELNDIENAEHAAQQIGVALADQDNHIVVYSSADHMFEVGVVSGYASSEKAKKGSIHVYFSTHGTPPRFNEQSEKGTLFNPEPDPSNAKDWEVSFYASIADVDGVILLGGGSSTLIAGLVALGHHKPIVTFGMFGGAANKVWKVLGVQKDYQIDKDDWDNMGYNAWSPDMAPELISALGRQIVARQETQQKEADSRQKQIDDQIQKIHLSYDNQRIRRNQARKYAYISIPLFIAVFVLWGISQATTSITAAILYAILVFVPLTGGVVGSSIRVVFNEFLGNTEIKIPDIIQNTALGLFSGGIAAALFISAQTTSINTLNLTPEQLAQQLKPLVFNAAIIGIFGGIAIDAVFSRIQSSDPLNPTTFLPTITNPSSSNSKEEDTGE